MNSTQTNSLSAQLFLTGSLWINIHEEALIKMSKGRQLCMVPSSYSAASWTHAESTRGTENWACQEGQPHVREGACTCPLHS